MFISHFSPIPLLYHLNFLHEIQREPFILYFCHFPESPSSFKTQLPVPVTLMFIVVTLHYLGGQTAAQPRQHLLHQPHAGRHQTRGDTWDTWPGQALPDTRVVRSRAADNIVNIKLQTGSLIRGFCCEILKIVFKHCRYLFIFRVTNLVSWAVFFCKSVIKIYLK